MTNWRKYPFVAAAVVLAGFSCLTNPNRRVSANLRDAVPDQKSGGVRTAIPATNKYAESIPEAKATAVESVFKSFVARNAPSARVPGQAVEFITIPGGKFTMGTDSGEEGFEDAMPAHEVVIKTFAISKTAVTVAQYAECVIKGGCTEPRTGAYCNWRVSGRGLHPINCVDWDQANMYAKFKGARLPSEAEWEYAATSGGRKQKYPWGNDEAGCDKAVMYSNGGYGCGKNSTWPVCSKTAGNTAQGLCDMAGNVWQWVQDKSQDSYKGAPVDGRASEGSGSFRVIRGGGFCSEEAGFLRADYRNYVVPGNRSDRVGIRLVRSR